MPVFQQAGRGVVLEGFASIPAGRQAGWGVVLEGYASIPAGRLGCCARRLCQYSSRLQGKGKLADELWRAQREGYNGVTPVMG